MSFGLYARFSFAVIILCFIAGITASAQVKGDSTLTYNKTTDTLTAQSVTLTAPSQEPGTAYILPESPYVEKGFLGSGDCRPQIVSSEIKDGTVEIVRRSECNKGLTYAVMCIPEPCDFTEHKIWKEIYRVQGDKLVFQKRIDGKIIPAQAERIEWPDSAGSVAGVVSLPGSGTLYAPPSTGYTITPFVDGITDNSTPFVYTKPPKKKHRHYRRTK